MNVKDLHKIINTNQLTMLFIKPNKIMASCWKNGEIPKKYEKIIKQFDEVCSDFEQKVINLQEENYCKKECNL